MDKYALMLDFHFWRGDLLLISIHIDCFLSFPNMFGLILYKLKDFAFMLCYKNLFRENPCPYLRKKYV